MAETTNNNENGNCANRVLGNVIDLDKKGFVFIDDKDIPYWVAFRYDKPMIAYWHNAQKSWVNLREVSQNEVMFMKQKALPDEQAMIYHNLHAKFCGGMMF